MATLLSPLSTLLVYRLPRPGRRPGRPAPSYDRYPSLSLSHGSPGPGRGSGLSGRGIWLHLVARCEDNVLIRALVHWQRYGRGLATKKQDFWPCLPPSLGFGSGGARSESGGPGSESPGPGVVVRCVVNGLLSTHKSPNFVLASLFWLFQLYNTVGTWIGLVNITRDKTSPKTKKRKQRVP